MVYFIFILFFHNDYQTSLWCVGHFKKIKKFNSLLAQGTGGGAVPSLSVVNAFPLIFEHTPLPL